MAGRSGNGPPLGNTGKVLSSAHPTQPMRFAITSNAGQVLATGSLFIEPDPGGQWRLCFRTDLGNIIEGGTVGEDGDLAAPGRILLEKLVSRWGVGSVTLNSGTYRG
jgi:hypothetical protein